jgi:hypothetical protein
VAVAQPVQYPEVQFFAEAVTGSQQRQRSHQKLKKNLHLVHHAYGGFFGFCVAEGFERILHMHSLADSTQCNAHNSQLLDPSHSLHHREALVYEHEVCVDQSTDERTEKQGMDSCVVPIRYV